MEPLPHCPKCNSSLTYEDGTFYICPECGHEWPLLAETEVEPTSPLVKDAHGNLLADGDSVTLIKDIKVKGASNPLKMGTKVKEIRLIPEVNGHNIDAKVPGFGALLLKSEFVKKTS